LDLGDDSKLSNSEMASWEGEMTMNQGDGEKKEDRSRKTREETEHVFRRRQRTLRQDVRHENRRLQRIAG